MFIKFLEFLLLVLMIWYFGAVLLKMYSKDQKNKKPDDLDET